MPRKSSKNFNFWDTTTFSPLKATQHFLRNGSMSHKIGVFIATAVSTSNPTQSCNRESNTL
jgi:hypothetical protein